MIALDGPGRSSYSVEWMSHDQKSSYGWQYPWAMTPWIVHHCGIEHSMIDDNYLQLIVDAMLYKTDASKPRLQLIK